MDRIVAQVDVEVFGNGFQHPAFDPGLKTSPSDTLFYKIACRVIVAKDIKTAKARRKQQGGEISGGETCRHGQSRKEGEKREHGLDAFARRHDIERRAEADR